MQNKTIIKLLLIGLSVLILSVLIIALPLDIKFNKYPVTIKYVNINGTKPCQGYYVTNGSFGILTVNLCQYENTTTSLNMILLCVGNICPSKYNGNQYIGSNNFTSYTIQYCGKDIKSGNICLNTNNTVNLKQCYVNNNLMYNVSCYDWAYNTFNGYSSKYFPSNLFFAYLYFAVTLCAIIIQLLPHYIFGKYNGESKTVQKQYVIGIFLTLIEIILLLSLMITINHMKRFVIITGIIIGLIICCSFVYYNILISNLCKDKYGSIWSAMLNIIWFATLLATFGNRAASFGGYNNIIFVFNLINACVCIIIYFNILFSQIYYRIKDNKTNNFNV